MERKTTRVELKEVGEGAETGEFSAVIATFNVVDKDGDVTLPGAFPEGKTIPISAYGHTSWQGALPVGKGVIHQDDEKAWVDGKFFLDTTPGRETYLTVKALANEADGSAGQEWSYGYDAVDSELGRFEIGDDIEQDVRFLKELDVHEASPVLLGAGIDTRLMDIKSTQPFADEGEAALAAVTAFITRARSLADLRAKDGRTLSVTNIERLEVLGAALAEAVETIKGMLQPPEGEGEAKASPVRALAYEALAEAARIRATINGGDHV